MPAAPRFDAPAALDTRCTLLVRLQKDEGEDSWAEFYGKYRHYVISTAMRAGLDAEQAHDVLQMVMMVVIREACGFHYDPDTRTFRNASVCRDGEVHEFVRFRSWLKGVVRIKVWEARKFAARGGVSMPEETTQPFADRLPDPGPQPDEAAEAASETTFRRAMLDQALATLRASYRGKSRNVELFEAIALRGAAYESVCAEHEVTEVHARQIVFNLRQKLREILEGLLHATPLS
jgi:DNA-directed RNA polymerase specialized sigma24 family protein